MQILLGCGRSRKKKVFVGPENEWRDLVTVDMNPEVRPDIVHDLAQLPYPFETDSADEIHAYDVMEHMGQQGDWRFFFAQWTEIWRILKPGGLFFGISPKWDQRWAWGDPGHTRVIQLEHLLYLNQAAYEAVGETPITDYRFVWKGDLHVVHTADLPADDGGKPVTWVYVLRAVK